jgi:1,4-alpha-glucan branching enzyme
MPLKGYFSLVLHAHLPFVKHPEHREALEEDWLFEALSETYIPLLLVFEKLASEKIHFRVTMTLSPTLLEMFADPLLQDRYVHHLEKLILLSEKEMERTKNEPAFYPLACMYREHFQTCKDYFIQRAGRNMVQPFKQLMDEGYLEIITCGATHGFFPLMAVEHEACVKAQVAVAVKNYEKHFNRKPRGIWLPECGYFPEDDKILRNFGIRFFFVDTHGLLHASPRPRYGVFAPCYTPSGVAVFARDMESSKQVWSSKEGYPGDFDYREFYRDIGWDLDYDYIRPFLHESGIRKNVGLKYYRITGTTDHKEPYNPQWAKEKAAIHAGNFLFNREKQVEYLFDLFKGKKPIIVSPYDAELFGHWWFEGPLFLDFLFRKMHYDQETIKAVTPIEYLEQDPVCQMVEPVLSSWGYKGYAEQWLNGSNDWIYRHLHHAAKVMVGAANDYPEASGLQKRALNQMARELLLAQSSDWAFIMKTGTVVEYAVRCTTEHIGNLLALNEQIRNNRIDEGWLSWLENRNSIFQEIDYHVYSSASQATP